MCIMHSLKLHRIQLIFLERLRNVYDCVSVDVVYWILKSRRLSFVHFYRCDMNVRGVETNEAERNCADSEC